MEIKGDRRGLRVLARGFDNTETLLADLSQTLQERQAFLGQAHLMVEVEDLPLTADLYRRIAAVFEQYPGLTLRGIQQADRAGTLIALDARPTPAAPPEIIRHTLRSGQRVMHSGDVIVIGDVNPGATVIAGGDVMVFGWLRGAVYAGQPDDPSRSIYALRFQPAQIRIGEKMALGSSDRGNLPEFARVDGEKVVVLPWEDIRLPDEVTNESRGGWRDRLNRVT